MNNGDKPAGVLSCDPETCEHTSCTGLTKREAFAKAAMQGDWAAQDDEGGYFENGTMRVVYETRAREWVRCADALLAALEEGE
jgi:hypothetical protein